METINNPLNCSKAKSLHIRPLKLNFALNATRLVLTFLMPLITFPYISRILQPEGIGKVEFANSIVSYIILFTALGIPVYGIREIARVRDDERKRSKTVWELTILLSLMVFIGYAVYFLLVFLVPQFKAELLLFCIVSPGILLSSFSYEWFYQGIEDQIYITIRFIVIKIIQVICIFVFIKRSDQYPLYAAVYVSLNSFSTIFNVLHLRKYVSRIPFKELDVKRHIKPVAVIFTSVVATTIYSHLDVTMTGFISGNRAVGLYTTANRLVRVVIQAVTTLSAVLIPRMENSLKNGNEKTYLHLLNVSLDYILILSIPCCLGIIALADDIIMIFAGAQYADAVFSIQLLSPIIVIVGLANFTGLQILYPHRKEWQYTVAVSVAAVLNAISNALLIPLFAQNGAVTGTLIAEFSGLMIQLAFARKYLMQTDLFSINTLKYLAAGAAMFAAVKAVPYINGNLVLHCVLSICAAAAVYSLMIILLREKTARECIHRVSQKLNRGKK